MLVTDNGDKSCQRYQQEFDSVTNIRLPSSTSMSPLIPCVIFGDSNPEYDHKSLLVQNFSYLNS